MDLETSERIRVLENNGANRELEIARMSDELVMREQECSNLLVLREQYEN
jgi:hypothetical protein